MAKLGKQKFSILGDHNSARTTFAGTFELYLYYNSEYDHFYFNSEEMKQYLPEELIGNLNRHTFSHCKTKTEAISVVETLIASEVKEARKLRIEIGMNSTNFNVPNPKYNPNASQSLKNWNPSEREEYIMNPELPSYLKDMLKRGSVYEAQGLTLNFERVMEVEVHGKKLYATCDSNWKYKRSNLHAHSANLIDWTPEMEAFLIDTQQKLKNLCQLVLDFFNAGEDVNNLIGKIQSNTKLLS